MFRRFSLMTIVFIVVLGSVVQAQDNTSRLPGSSAGGRALGGGGTPASDFRDQGFESGFGAPLRSPDWLSESSNFGTPVCDAGCGLSAAQGPNDGAFWVWFGGANGAAETAFIEQQLYIPSNTETYMNYDYWIGLVDAGATYSMTVSLDGSVVDSIVDSPVSGGYISQSIDLGTYADGGLHTFRMDFTKNAIGNVNLNIDNVYLYKGTSVYLADADFESGSAAWIQTGKTGDKVKCNTLTKTYGYTGLCAFFFKGSIGENSTAVQQYTVLRAAPPAPGRAPSHSSVYLGAFINAKPSATGKMILKLTLDDDSKIKAKVSLAGSNSYTWKQTPPKLYDFALNIVKVSVKLLHTSAAGKVLIDDIEVFRQGVYP